ncbi:PIN domain-containing protein [Dictyobacter vulcani]|uniref:PIN domain-containing protein n=1 Tax=Dictyobacter vulcani TaxID=2607529 RepID=A0A5J4KRC5_9CHLR|nr:PIN domain-containing protein [Dictyobacter vulcani]GER89000.1 PIN domain-containing protein [Dictyobacter vulcani]
MSSLHVVLDANVIFPASLRDILLRLAADDLYRLYITDEILEETCRNLIIKGRMTESGTLHLKREIKRSFPEAFVNGYQLLIPSMSNHVKDRHVLATAVKVQAQVIVTQNLKDFPSNSLSPFDIEAQSPDDFLVHLHYLNSEVVARNLIEQAGDLRKPSKTVPELLDILAQHTPRFVALARVHFSSTSYSWPQIQD